MVKKQPRPSTSDLDKALMDKAVQIAAEWLLLIEIIKLLTDEEKMKVLRRMGQPKEEQ